jgi:hypothetical protein
MTNFREEWEKQVSPLRFAPVEMTIFLIEEKRVLLLLTVYFAALRSIGQCLAPVENDNSLEDFRERAL